MQRTTYCPIRNTVGALLPIEDVTVVGQSDILNVFPASFLVSESNDPARQQVYRRYWPRLKSPTLSTALPAKGMTSCPLPTDAPFPAQQPALMLYGLHSRATRYDFAEYWVEYEITIGIKNHFPVVGGVALAGCPYLPYLATPEGDNLANFGVPREIRVSWREDGAVGFMDAEQQFTLQMPNWHSGFHFLSFGPVRTTKLRLRLSTFPHLLLPAAAGLTPARPPLSPLQKESLVGVPGFLIPFVYVFAHQENVAYEPHVPGGLLAAWQSPPATRTSYATQYPYAPTSALSPSDPADRVEIISEAIAGTSTPRYLVFSAASAIGAARVATLSSGDVTEFFCSNQMKQGDDVVLVIAQARQNEACIAGLRLMAPKKTELLGDAVYDEPFVLNVYETDLPTGAEPLERAASGRVIDYRVRIASARFVPTQSAVAVDIKFTRPSNARHFTLTFTATRSGQVLALRTLELVQSAQVTLAPKAARRTQVRHLNFRLVGRNLAAEYDKLGDGAALQVERLSGPGRAEIVFRAESLLELVERTGAKLYRNGRAWEVVQETAHVEARSGGWQRRESGNELRWQHTDLDSTVVPSSPPQPTWSSTNTAATFLNFGHQQIRTHTEQLGYQNDPGTRSVLRTVNNLIRAATADDDEIFVAPTAANANRLVTDFQRVWTGLSDANRDKLRTIRGTYNLNVPPHALATSYLSMLDHLVNNVGDPASTTNSFLSNAVAGGLLSGSTVSVGASVSAIFAGANVSYTLGQQLPAASRGVQMGDTGSIQLQGTDTGYQYAQTINSGFDDSKQIREVLDRKRNVLLYTGHHVAAGVRRHHFGPHPAADFDGGAGKPSSWQS